METNGLGRRIALALALATAFVLAARTDVLVAAWKELVGLIGLKASRLPHRRP